MDRRGFLKTILAAGVAPAVCKAEFLMPGRAIIVPRPLFRGEIGEYSGIVFHQKAPAVLVQNQELATGAYQQFGTTSRIAQAAYAQRLYNKLVSDQLFQILKGPQA